MKKLWRYEIAMALEDPNSFTISKLSHGSCLSSSVFGGLNKASQILIEYPLLEIELNAELCKLTRLYLYYSKLGIRGALS